MIQRTITNFLDTVSQSIDISFIDQEKAISRYVHLGQWLLDEQGGVIAPEVYPQGSFRLGTVVRPLDSTGEFDIDLVFLRHLKRGSITQEQLKADAGALLARYCEQFDFDPPVELGRCWRLEFFDDHFHIDVLPVIPDENVDTGILLSDRDLREWLYSNPIGYADWFYEQMNQEDLQRRREAFALAHGQSPDDVPRFFVRTPLQRVVQLLKRSRDAFFLEDPTDQPPSILITTLAALAYRGQTDIDGAFAEVAAAMPHYIEDRNGVWWLPNPAHPSENFADKWNSNPQRRESFIRWMASVVHATSHAAHAMSVDRVGEAFQPVLGSVASYSADALQSRQPGPLAKASTGETRAPDERFIEEMFPVDIKHKVSVAFEVRDHSELSRFHRRSALKQRHLAKAEQLRFTITSTTVPEPYDVYWKVRNFGPEAAHARQLRGQIKRDAGGHQRRESTRYRGEHWAECYIVKDGVCVARKKVWVPIA